MEMHHKTCCKACCSILMYVPKVVLVLKDMF